MSKEKQIDEMAKHCPCYFGEKCCIDGELPEKCDMLCQFGTYAEILYTAGYRKQKEVAREIFKEIEKLTPKKFTEKSQDFEFGYALAIQQIKNKIAELKKKYTEAKK